MRRACSALLVVAGLLSGAVGAAQTKRALLIGIDLYQPKGTTPQCPKDEDCSVGRFTLVAFDNLVGPVNDAELMAEVLTNPKFGFPSQQVRLLLNPDPEHPPGVAAPPGVEVLTAGQTTRSGILAAMQKYLVDLPQHFGAAEAFAQSFDLQGRHLLLGFRQASDEPSLHDDDNNHRRQYSQNRSRHDCAPIGLGFLAYHLDNADDNGVEGRVGRNK